jgi:hypothetical protein
MTAPYENRFGRRGGRGWRPWILLPKVIAVGLSVGSLAAVLLVWFGSDFSSLDKADPRRLWVLGTIGLLVRVLVVPSLLLAVIFGVVLFLQHPRQFIRMRWLVVKLATLAVLLPGAHFFLYWRAVLLRDAAARQVADNAAATQFGWGFVIVLIVLVWVVSLGRLKPRLGQNWAKGYAASLPPAET